ncbi:ATP-grasp domain-containing protein [Butyrivibrio sp.]|uniref:ATP-grasp domain-containing protein n=1 Tax=Butyrivibrio sp. TaxID=28121 RepID=UPI0025C6C00C|nr:ATP-grasp domain-containing protein [Butyrivibrio sp.]
MDLSGKRILMLGSNVASVDIVNYLRKKNAFVYVTDNLPKSKSPAKQVADEIWNVSTLDTEMIIKLVKQNGITNILSGISEVNLLQAIRLNELLDFPFYCNEEQWDMISNKELFKNLCNKNGVSSTKTYYSGPASDIDDISAEAIKYPIIVKPVDSTASIGITIVDDKNKFDHAIGLAEKHSKSKRIIIEEYVKGYEFTAHYVIHNGLARLVTVDNRYPVCLHEGAVTTIPIGRVFPSLFAEKFLKKMEKKMELLCCDIGLKYGVMFVQGIYDDKADEFKLFEAGLRPAAESVYKITSLINGQNFAQMLIDEIVAGESTYEIRKEDPFLSGKSAGIISIASPGGKVGRISGVTDVLNTISNIKFFEQRYFEGDEIPSGDTLRQLVLRFTIVANNREDMVNDIKRINDCISISDSNGKTMDSKIIPEAILNL